MEEKCPSKGTEEKAEGSLVRRFQGKKATSLVMRRGGQSTGPDSGSGGEQSGPTAHLEVDFRSGVGGRSE